MATISTTLKLIDGVTGPLMSMARSINNVIRGINSLSAKSVSVGENLSFAADSAGMINSAIGQANATMGAVSQSVANLAGEYGNAKNGQISLNKEINNGVSAGSKLLGAIKGIAGTYLTFQGIKSIISWSDEMTNINARIGIIKGDMDTVAGLQDKIMASANRTYSSYMSTANAITQFGMAAGDAFKNTDEIIQFTELLNKQFTISGVKAEQQASVLFNMTQALSAGVLRGQDLNTIMQNMAPYAQMIADTLGVSKAEMRDLAAQGKISAQIMKDALLSNAEKINEQYEAMPYTFEDMWNLVKNSIVSGFRNFQGVLERTVNSENLKTAIEAVGKAMRILGAGVTFAIKAIIDAVAIIYRTLSAVSPLVWTLVGGFVAYKTVMLSVIAVQKVWAGIVAVFGALTRAISMARAAVLTFNAAWLACPATWVILGIIAAISAVVAAVAYFSNSFEDAMGNIVGGIYSVGAAMGNIFISAFNGILYVADKFINVFIGIWETFLNIFGGGFDNVCGAVQSAFGTLVSGLMTTLKPFVWMWDKVFSTNGMDVINSWQDSAKSWGQNTRTIKLQRDILTNNFSKDTIDLGGAFSSGYDVGANAAKSIRSAYSNMFSVPDFTQEISTQGSFAQMNNSLSDISKNTEDTIRAINGVNDTLEISDEDAELMRALAEREAINRFTTAEIKLDFTANNNVSNPFDIGSVISELERQLTRSIKTAMEGSY